MPKFPSRADLLRHLSRTEAPNTPGWLLRLIASAAERGEPFEMSFADSLFGGREASLRAAQAQRDALEDRGRVGCHLRETAASRRRGLPVGVRLVYLERPSGPLVMWDILWTDDGENRRKRLSLSAHGYRGGFAKAIALRAEKSGLDLSAWECPPIESLLDAKQLGKLRGHPRAGLILAR